MERTTSSVKGAEASALHEEGTLVKRYIMSLILKSQMVIVLCDLAFGGKLFYSTGMTIAKPHLLITL